MLDLDHYIALGYKVINEMFGLEHSGIKGQKWGVKNGPPYPLSKDMHDSIVGKGVVENAIKSGQVSTKVNPEKQNEHTLKGRKPGKSYLNGDVKYAQELVDKLSGTGTAVMSKKDKWQSKEKVENDSIIGVYVNPKTGESEETNKAMIVYSPTRTHIYPRSNEDRRKRKGGRKK